MRFDHTGYERVDDIYRMMETEFLSGSSLVNGILGQVLSARGKGVRPEFMYLTARLAGGGWETVRRAAAMIEAVHLASLLHDDVVDASVLRRGAATLNRRYSDKLSVLFGDYVFLRALSLLSALGDSRIAGVMERAMGRMFEGEIADSLASPGADEDRYLSVIADKTASLFSAAGEIGMILAGGDDDARATARELGECAGMAFQIVDDALDCDAGVAGTGKTPFMDIRTGCLTLPLIHAVREGGSGIWEALGRADCPVECVADMVRETGGIGYSFDRAAEYARRGKDLLRHWAAGESRDAMDRFFDSLVNRRY